MYHIHHENAHFDFSDGLTKELKKVVGRTSIAWLDAARGIRMFTPQFGLCTRFQMILTNERIAPSDARSLPSSLILHKKDFESRQAELKVNQGKGQGKRASAEETKKEAKRAKSDDKSSGFQPTSSAPIITPRPSALPSPQATQEHYDTLRSHVSCGPSTAQAMVSQPRDQRLRQGREVSLSESSSSHLKSLPADHTSKTHANPTPADTPSSTQSQSVQAPLNQKAELQKQDSAQAVMAQAENVSRRLQIFPELNLITAIASEVTKAVLIQTSNSDDSLPKGTDEEGKVEEEETQSSTFDDLAQLNVNLSELKQDNISSVSTTEKVPAGEKTLAEQLSGPEVRPLVSVSEKDSEKQSQPAEAEKPGKDVNTSSSEEKKGKQDKEFSFTQTENRSEGLTENLVQDLSSTQPRTEEGSRAESVLTEKPSQADDTVEDQPKTGAEDESTKPPKQTDDKDSASEDDKDGKDDGTDQGGIAVQSHSIPKV